MIGTWYIGTSSFMIADCGRVWCHVLGASSYRIDGKYMESMESMPHAACHVCQVMTLTHES